MSLIIPDDQVEAALRNPRPILRDLDRLDCEESLLDFVRQHWHVLEPNTQLVEGWPLEAICEHLEAVTWGDLTRLLINVPPGFMKSLDTNVFWPAREWGPQGLPHLRYVTFSYAATLTERDNGRFRDLLMSTAYQGQWADRFSLRKTGEVRVTNDRTGWKLASSVGGVGTGERGDRILLDDPHNIKEGESDKVRGETVRWFRESMSNRLNDMDRSAVVIIMQRVHDADVSGTVLTEGMGYEHLMIPMEFDARRRCVTGIGWEDPRYEEGELAWPERFPRNVVEQLKIDLGPYAYAAQYQQSPQPRGGGIIKRDWWQPWPPDDWGPDELPTAGGKVLFPPMEFVLCQVDTAMTEKEENDWSACTTWGVWRDRAGIPRVMLMGAWQERLEFKPLVDKLILTARQRKADMVRIEAKVNGFAVAQEMSRLCRDQQFSVHLSKVKGDKVARAYAVQHMWSAGLIYAPERKWADMVIDQVSAFPKAQFDDLTDTATAAVKYLRDTGMLQLVEEHQEDVRVRTAPPGQQEPLYDA